MFHSVDQSIRKWNLLAICKKDVLIVYLCFRISSYGIMEKQRTLDFKIVLIENKGIDVYSSN